MNLTRIATVAVASAAAVTLAAGPSLAAVNVTNGVGFVGKGDVQNAFGWSNKQAQANAQAVTFSVNTRDTYDVECEWTTVTGGKSPKVIVHDIIIPRHTSVSSAVAADPRKTGQWTGYNLSGLQDTVVTGTEPVLGGTCPGQGNQEGAITDIVLISSTGGLFVNFDGTSVAMPNTPVVVLAP